jgi:hypothetical protein
MNTPVIMGIIFFEIIDKVYKEVSAYFQTGKKEKWFFSLYSEENAIVIWIEGLENEILKFSIFSPYSDFKFCQKMTSHAFVIVRGS